MLENNGASDICVHGEELKKLSPTISKLETAGKWATNFRFRCLPNSMNSWYECRPQYFYNVTPTQLGEKRV